MASQKTGGASSSTHLERIGYDCQFIGDIPKDGQCPGCRLVYRYPHQTKCCGKRICEGCVERLKASSKPCPFPSCNAAKILSFPDKACVQSLGKYKVNCPNRSEGCKWEGELAKLAFHLNLEPSTDKQVNKVCLLSKKECCFCFKLFEYRFMKTHQSRECPKRPHECAYCHYKASFEEVTHQHSNKCPSAPVTCPNNCEHAVLRCELEHHRNHDCPLEIQQCEFRAVGCQVELPRKDMSDHKREGVAEHSLLLSTTLQKAMADITSLQNEKADVTSLQRARTDITTLQSEKADVTSLQGAVTDITSLQTKKADVTLLQRAVADITSLQGTMESYIARKSRALQDNLDKMQEGMITQSKKIYVGIVLLAIVTVVVTMQSGQHLMTGRMTGMEDQTDFCTFDNCERSSMEGREEWHKELDSRMEREQNERHEELNSRMEREQKERHELNSRMEQEQRERREELDRKVEEIMLQVKEYDSAERQERQQLQGQLRELWDKLDEEIKKRLETGINRVVNLKHLKLNFLPFEFEMKNFTNYKKNGIAWDSPPFYTIDGYKMRIRVEAKGYVSVSALRMAGLVDDDLRWPFKQNITIMLMNQASSWNLFSYYFWMTESQIGTLQFTKQ